jgi:glycosyltransferase involved in cell wall biosynthesis
MRLSSVGLSRRQQQLISLVDFVLPMADGERRELLHRFDIQCPMGIVENGSTFVQPELPEGARSNDVVVVGRVEPRKNTVEIARSLAELGVSAVFLGAPNNNHNSYVTEFRRIISRYDKLTYHGSVDLAKVRATLLTSKYYVNASWCEVVSQADIEAASSGCMVISTRHSYLSDFLGCGYAVIDPLCIASGRGTEHLDKAMQLGVRGSSALMKTWPEAITALDDVYRKVTS